MKALFIELPAFQRHREDYLDKDEVADLTPSQRQQLKAMVKAELKARSGQ